jgi:hypothetical protein
MLLARRDVQGRPSLAVHTERRQEGPRNPRRKYWIFNAPVSIFLVVIVKILVKLIYISDLYQIQIVRRLQVGVSALPVITPQFAGNWLTIR